MSQTDSFAFKFKVRDAMLSDHGVIVDFNQRLAWETESKRLNQQILEAGVTQALQDPSRLRYWIAVNDHDDEPLGMAAISMEWSDWRNGFIWWLQSVYVVEKARGVGVFKGLHGRIREEALASPDVIGLRLYVEENNERAQQVYRRLGMEPGGYHVYQELWLNRSQSH